MDIPVYQEIYDKSVVTTIQSNYAHEIRQLRSLNFNEDVYLCETSSAWTALDSFPMLVKMWKRGAVLRVKGLLRVEFLNVYLIHDNKYAYSVISKNFGIKYTTLFDDGTMLHTLTRKMGGQSLPEHQYIYQEYYPENISMAWQKHVESVKMLTGKGLTPISLLGVGDIIRMEHHSDRILLRGSSELSTKKKKLEI